MAASDPRNVPAQLESPFLASKIQPPATDGELIVRVRLVDQLQQGERCELTVVSGPAGSGKTSVLADWASAWAPNVAWLHLDEHDNDPTQFWTGVLAALAAVPGTALTDHVVPLVEFARSDHRVFLSSLDERLAESGARHTLVLDDLHLVANPSIHEALHVFADRLGAHVRLIVATRTTPPLGLARRRARRQLCEIRFDDLRFTIAEARALVQEVLKQPVSDEVAEKLHRSSDGWAAALYVMALGLASNSGSEYPLSPTADRNLSDYLLEEVLGRESEERRQFMLESSILDHLSARRCNAVTNRMDSAEVLRDLEGSSQFVRRIGPTGQLFGYHSLLRDLLRVELGLLHPERIAELHARAAASAIAEHDAAGAIHHAIESQDLDYAADLIATNWIDFTNRGLFATVMAWLARWKAADADTSATPADPTIFIVGSWMALHTGRLSQVESWLTRAENSDHEGSLPDGTSSVRAAIAIVRSSHRRRVGSISQALAAGVVANELESDPSSPWRAVAMVGYGAALYWSGDRGAAQACFEEALEVAQATGLHVPRALSLGYMAMLSRDRDDLETARGLADRAIAQIQSTQLTGYDQAAPAFLVAGLSHLDRIELDLAEQRLHRALDLATQGAESLLQARAHAGLARVAELAGDDNLAAIRLAAAQRLVSRCDDPGPLAVDLLAGWLNNRGDTTAIAYPELTERELTVLRFLRSSLTLPEIAAELYVSPNTIKSHTAAIRSKLGVTNRSDAVRTARNIGLLPA